MNSELLSLLLSWVPLIVVVVIWVWVWRSLAKRWRSPSGATWGELTEQQLAQTRRMNATLERIAMALENRAQGEQAGE
jgi:hypothetical protein